MADWQSEGESEATAPEKARFPTEAVGAVAALVLLHFALVAWHMGAFSGGENLLARGGLRVGVTWEQPWRLVSSVLLHVDARHAFWNGVALMVFAVPLIGWLGLARTGVLYVAAGAGGGLAAVGLAPEGTLIVGSSGAVAGVFGAWITITFRSSRWAPISWRARVRTIGISLLFLPSLLSPSTPDGRPISVGSHLGGMATGMLIGAILSAGLLPRPEPDPFASEEEDTEREPW